MYGTATLPNLPATVAASGIGPGYMTTAFDALAQVAASWAARFQTLSYGGLGRGMLQAAMYSIPLLWLAAAGWSMRAKTWRPFTVTVIASLAGLVGVPIAMWLYWILRWLYGLVGIVGGIIGKVLTWAVTIAVVAAIVVAIGFGIYVAFAAIRNARTRSRTRSSRFASYPEYRSAGRYRVSSAKSGRRRPIAATATVLAIAVLGALAAVDLFGGGTVIGSLWDAIATAFLWLLNGIGSVLSWVGRLLTIVADFVIVHVVVLLVCNQFGRLVCVPLRSATHAAIDEGKCADIAAGVGMAWSLLLAAAAFDPVFGEWFTGVWDQMPLVGLAPAPVGLWEVVLSDAAEGVLRPVFTGFAPFVDLAMMLAVTGLAVLSPMLRRGAWKPSRPMDIIVPAAAAMATGLVAPVIAFGLWVANRGD
ncbi:hypothetical protein [Glycomyces sp. YM15]|uniref:hypothetical protein n=1 Tax=Glycomyces sp. YM15 TaxID=2800446 RepID=UPI00196699BE|nr:hypothetical protein [Glycomyces sp. YM15]